MNERKVRFSVNKEKPSISKNKLKINIKSPDIKDISSRLPQNKMSNEKHQWSNNEPVTEFDSLLDDNDKESNFATERYTSSLIDNFDQSEFIKNVIIQSRKWGGSRFGSPGQNNSNSASVKQGNAK